MHLTGSAMIHLTGRGLHMATAVMHLTGRGLHMATAMMMHLQLV